MTRLAIGPFTLDTSSGELRAPDGTERRLGLHSTIVLSRLAEANGEVVSKEGLLSCAWDGVNVSEDSLFQSIHEIRSALGTEYRAIVETLPRRGYRLNETQSCGNGPTQAPIAYAMSPDGTRIAWTEGGQGIPVLKAPNWLSHLALEIGTDLYKPFYTRLHEVARVVRFDQRGNGMSDWTVPPLTMDAMVEDTEAVVEASGLDRFFLYGLSQGVTYAIAYAHRHPDRVLGIIGRGGYAVGNMASGRPDRVRDIETRLTVIRNGWDARDDSYRRFITSKIMPDAPPHIAREFDSLQAAAVSAEQALAFVEFSSRIDIRHIAPLVNVPILLVHSRGDRMIPIQAGRELAALLPNARLVELESENHTLVPGTEGFETGISEMIAFLQAHAE